jgi:hypothetical protein
MSDVESLGRWSDDASFWRLEDGGTLIVPDAIIRSHQQVQRLIGTLQATRPILALALVAAPDTAEQDMYREALTLVDAALAPWEETDG